VTAGPGSKYVALLKGVNVGRNQRVAMTALRELLIGLGYNNVRTHLESDNALFTSRKGDPAKLAREIEKAIDRKLGLRIRCLVRTRDELGPDQIRLVDREIYQWCPNGILAAPNLSAFVEKYLKVTVTNRNWNTVTRLGALLDEA
jgi:uncharacterized protein (DUF1697 family)